MSLKPEMYSLYLFGSISPSLQDTPEYKIAINSVFIVFIGNFYCTKNIFIAMKHYNIKYKITTSARHRLCQVLDTLQFSAQLTLCFSIQFHIIHKNIR